MTRDRGLSVRRRAAAALAAALALAGFDAAQSTEQAPNVPLSAIAWADLPAAIQRRLAASGLDASRFVTFRQEQARRTAERVRESDLDALVYYALQSTTFTNEPAIEPALDAKRFVEGLDADLRARFLAGSAAPVDRVPAQTRRRLNALRGALEDAAARGRIGYFRDVVRDETSRENTVAAVLLREYVRAMRFLYEKEFVAPRKTDAAAAIAALYRERGLSTDTAIEAGYLVHLGLATIQASDPGLRIQRVLVVGPGLDLAPRTGLLEVGEPESYQPYALVDSLVRLGLASTARLAVVGADVNQRVVDRLRSARDSNVALTLVTGVGETESVQFDDGFRRYFEDLGRRTGEILPPPALGDRHRGHLKKALRISTAASQVITGARLDIVTERISSEPFDLIIATNIFPYLDDVQLTLALTNIAAMLRPGGVLLHNEARALIGEVTGELALPLTHSRTAVIATVRGSATPLYDSVFVHVKARSADWFVIRDESAGRNPARPTLTPCLRPFTR
jgi:hypothetical protein